MSLKSLKSLKFAFICLICLSLFSCGQQQEAEEEPQGNPNNYTWTQPMRVPQTYGEEEMKIATDVCRAFQEKRALVNANGTLDMDFRLTEQNCSAGTGVERRASGRMQALRDGQLRLTNLSRGTQLYSDVLSDQHPKVKNFCDLVLRGEAPSNTQRDGVLRYQVTFFRQAGFDYIQIAEFRESNGIYFPYLIERASVFTATSTTNRNNYGFVKVRGVNTPCANRASTNTVLQEWL